MRKRISATLAIMITGALLLEAATVTEEAAEEDIDMALIEAGKTLFLRFGCAACHGLDAEGSAFAPALPGHSREAVFRQTRTPRGAMPAFSTTQLSDDDLEKIAAYIVSLEGEHAHEFELEAPELAHHLMAIESIKVDDLQDAAHHVQHALDFIHEHAHEHQMEEVLELLAAGEAHEAEHLLAEMVGVLAEQEGKSLAQFHLELALTAVRDHDIQETQHHLTHFIELASDIEKIEAQKALDLLAAGDTHNAEHRIEELLGVNPHGE